MDTQQIINEENSKFWNELCGTGLAKHIGITDHSEESLRKFDKAYMDIYPYLAQYVPGEIISGKSVLEIGLGYGTLSQKLIELGADYHGLDISKGPVDMVKGRLRILGKGDESKVVQGSALEIPFDDATFDTVVSIGCLHHTGDLAKSVREVRRVLKDGGTAVIMVYNSRSWRQFAFRFRHPSLWFQGKEAITKLRAHYDANAAGEAAPQTEYTSPGGLKKLFEGYSKYTYDIQNMDGMGFWKIRIPREKLLNNVGRVAGLDLYVTAVK